MKKRNPTTYSAPTELAPQVLTIEEVAAVLKVGRDTVYKMINLEGLPYVLIGKGKRVPVSSLQWWLKHRECNPYERSTGQTTQKSDQMHEKEPGMIQTTISKKASPRKTPKNV